MWRLKNIWFTLSITWIALFCNYAWTQTAPAMYTLELRVFHSFHPIKQPVQNIRVDLTDKNKSVICSGITDSLGAVFFDNACMQRCIDTVIIKFYRGDEHLPWDDREFVNSLLINGQKRSFDFIKEIQLIKSCFGLGHINQPLYETFETLKFTGFSLDEFKELLAMYPSLCIKFTQTKHDDESDEIATERMKNFELYLNQAGLDMRRLEFSYDFHVLHANIPNHDGKPRIDLVLNSFDCD
jgi:hypothetical protein